MALEAVDDHAYCLVKCRNHTEECAGAVVRYVRVQRRVPRGHLVRCVHQMEGEVQEEGALVRGHPPDEAKRLLH